MPEGPEVRRAADGLNEALAGQAIVAIEARTKRAKAWLAEHPETLLGRRVRRVWSHGKHLLGAIEGGYYFHSHALMWGRWSVVASDDEALHERDRRERARIVVAGAAALLYSAPTFDVGRGDPYRALPHLADLGPDILPYPSSETSAAGSGFDTTTFFARLALDPDRTIGAALLDQTVAAGIGNYLRAEILFACRLDPWRPVGSLDDQERAALANTTVELARRAYEHGGRTVPAAVQAAMQSNRDLRYAAVARDLHTRHWVFRRTNLPCLRCDDYIRQKKQLTRAWEGDDGALIEKERPIYFCPSCQDVSVEVKPARPHRHRRDR